MKRRQSRPATALHAAAPKARRAQVVAPLGVDADEAARLGRTRTAQLRLVRAVLVLAGHLRTRIDAQLAADGLTTQQAAVMTIVRSAGRPSFREVAEALGTSPQNVRQLVEVLVRKGFARVMDDTEDRRVKRLVATAKNARYWAARDDRDHEALLALLDDLSTAETEQALEALVRVLDRARARPDPPPPRRRPAVRRASRGPSR